MNTEHLKMNEQQSNGNEQLFYAELIAKRDAGNYTVRIVPNYEDISVPLENNLFLQQQLMITSMKTM